jgi:hypothetical protein
MTDPDALRKQILEMVDDYTHLRHLAKREFIPGKTPIPYVRSLSISDRARTLWRSRP